MIPPTESFTTQRIKGRRKWLPVVNTISLSFEWTWPSSTRGTFFFVQQKMPKNYLTLGWRSYANEGAPFIRFSVSSIC